jgi:hypothetical protein
VDVRVKRLALTKGADFPVRHPAWVMTCDARRHIIGG